MIPTNLSMNWALNTLVFLFCIVAVRSHSKPVECPNCELCPIDDQGCCFTEDKTQIPNGGSFNPNAGVPEMYYIDNNCANFTCVDGRFKKEYYCPLGYKPLGTGCYHIGPQKKNFHDAKHYCDEYDSHLAILDTSEKAVRLGEDIKPMIWELVNNDMEGIFWLGASEYNQGGHYWMNGRQVEDGYTNFIGSGVDGYFISAYSKEGYEIDLHWRYKDGNAYAYPLCQRRYCKRAYTCYYEGLNYNIGEIILKNPKCDCSWLECGGYGQIIAISKAKPCCLYNGEVFGDGDDVYIDKCSKLVCKKGKLVSYPYCSSGAYPGMFIPITYNGTSSCYAFIREYKTYEEAVRYCASHDSKLAEITSKGENEAVENAMKNVIDLQQNENSEMIEMWLGGRAEVCDNGKLGHFHWTSAESRRLPVEAVYEDFCDKQPSKETGAHCLHTTFTREKEENYFCWANSACHKRKFFLCEKCSSCEQIYKNVCYRNNHGAGEEFFCDGDLISSGYNQPQSRGYAPIIPTCYEEHCENGKIVHKSFICGDGYNQVAPPPLSRKDIEGASGKKKIIN